MVRLAAAKLALFTTLLAAALFASAGRMDLPFFWAYLALLVVPLPLTMRLIDPELLKERVKPGPGGVDRRIRAMIIPFFLLHTVVAGLDAGRFGWSHVPAPLQVASLAGMAAAMSVSVWAMSVNRFFSPVVRIQTERGHHLIDRGPYAFIRHPGYLAGIAMMLFSGVALGSWWSLLPNVGSAAIMLRRAMIEDRFLHQHLRGYVEYAGRVRWRLVPGLW